jgi:hypothetical protein
MDFLTILSYVLAVVETGALIGTMIYITRIMQEKKLQRTKRGKKGGKSSELTKKAINVYYRNAGIFFGIYLVLNLIRRYSGIFE